MIRNNPDFREQRKRYCVYDVYYLLVSIECLKVNNWLKEKLLFFFFLFPYCKQLLPGS